MDLQNYLKANSYPGRGILLGKIEDYAVIAYFIMGRSVNSRNRIFEECADGIRTKAFDESKMTDPSLIIYYPYRVHADKHIITNGDQTDTIFEYIKKGKTFEEALETRTFEPDAPNFTPRISGMVQGDKAVLSILKKDSEDTARNFYRFTLQKGEGKLIHTYEGDGDPLPSFTGEPRSFAIGGSLKEFSDYLWESLHCDNKVSLLVKKIAKDGTVETIITNKNAR